MHWHQQDSVFQYHLATVSELISLELTLESIILGTPQIRSIWVHAMAHRLSARSQVTHSKVCATLERLVFSTQLAT